MSFHTLLGRGILRRSSVSLLAVATLLAGTMMIERILDSRLAVTHLDSDSLSGSKLYLGVNAIGAPTAPRVGESERLIELPVVDDLPYRHQSVLGLLVLATIGFVASIRPFDPKQSVLEQDHRSVEHSEP